MLRNERCLAFLLMILYWYSGKGQIIAQFVDSVNSSIVVKKIYGNGNYCAFTSLVEYRGKYYCAFREGETHVADGDDGVIRIISSEKGDMWNLEETLYMENVDLRDPNLSVMPNGKLLLLCGARMKNEDGNYVTKTYYSIKKNKKSSFRDLKPVVLPPSVDGVFCAWCWKLTWGKKYGYTIEYRHDGMKWRVDLLRTKDGRHYEHITELAISNAPTEGKVAFTDKGQMLAIVRTNDKGYYGYSAYPFREWKWERMPFFVGGHDILINGNYLICASRCQTPKGNKTQIYYTDVNTISEGVRLTLPSGGDNGYCGLLSVDNEWWISYYSAHEYSKPSIYLARIPKSIYE